MATARLMETWAHSLDVHSALGVTPEPSNRIRHIAHLAVRTRNFSFVTNSLTPPATEFRIDLVAPDGDVWTFGPEDAEQTVTGSALDLCLLAARRGQEDQRVAALRHLMAAQFRKAELVAVKVERGVEVGHADHGVQIFHGFTRLSK